MPEIEKRYINEAAKLDEADELRDFRNEFYIPHGPDGREIIYLTGNSLGLQPKTARGYVNDELDDWKNLGVEGHLGAKNPWLPYHEFLTANMAAVVGALPSETVVMNSLTVNLHLLMVSFFRPDQTRTRIIIEKGAFPSDRYAVVSQLRAHGLAPETNLIELAPRNSEAALRTEDILRTIETEADNLALILLGGVNYYTGQAFDIAAITEAGHRAGAIVAFDLAHAAGNVTLKLHDWDVDFAAWCGYKYLNGGPGAVAGAFIHECHARAFDLPRFAGWWGHDKETRFLMEPDFVPMAGAEGWQVSNPPILQMAALRASLEIFAKAGMSRLEHKSRRLTDFLRDLLMDINDHRIEIITPAAAHEHGCQLSIRSPAAGRELFDSIVRRGVSADWREPDVIRVAPVPLYNSFADVAAFAHILKSCLR